LAKFRIIISDPDSGTSKTLEVEENRAVPLIGRKIGEVLDGTIVGMTGHKVKITGGSDKDGFPMRPSVHGGVRRKVMLGGGVGFNPKTQGERERKTVRGNVVTDEIVQLNMKIVEKPKHAKKETKDREEEKKKQTEEEEKEPPRKAST
jgi:small subunit ribosomal protein S6e